MSKRADKVECFACDTRHVIVVPHYNDMPERWNSWPAIRGWFSWVEWKSGYLSGDDSVLTRYVFLVMLDVKIWLV